MTTPVKEVKQWIAMVGTLIDPADHDNAVIDLAKLIPHLSEAFPPYAFSPKTARLVVEAPRYGKIVPPWDVISATLNQHIKDTRPASEGPRQIARERPKTDMDLEDGPLFSKTPEELAAIRRHVETAKREHAEAKLAEERARPSRIGPAHLRGDDLLRQRAAAGIPTPGVIWDEKR